MIKEALLALHRCDDSARAERSRGFFKPNEKDVFCGVAKPQIRAIAKDFLALSLADIKKLMQSKIHEERTLGQVILCMQYKKGHEQQQEAIYAFYCNHLGLIHDWDAVDDTAPVVMGAHLYKRDRSILWQLAASKRMWDRRIAIASTLYFIRQNDLKDTYIIAEKLLNDKEDLIHKATGWMLREAGKKNENSLKEFLQKHAIKMPRTMLRYSIERFSQVERMHYLSIS